MPPSTFSKKRKTPAASPKDGRSSKLDVQSPFSLRKVSGVPDIQTKPLTIQVPEIGDPSAVPEVELEYDYQWQNPALLQTMYDRKDTEGNERLNSLRQFLYLMKELEMRGLEQEAGELFTEEEIRILVADDRDTLQGELQLLIQNRESRTAQRGENKETLKALGLEKKEAVKDKSTALKGKRAREVNRIKITNEKAIASNKEKHIKSALGNLAWAENRKQYWSKEKYDEQVKFWTNRKLKWERKNAERQQAIDEIMPEYNTLVAPFADRLEQIKAKIVALNNEQLRLKNEETQSGKDQKRIEKELKEISQIEKGDIQAVRTWKKARMSRNLEEMDHEQLMEEVQRLFATDPAAERFPLWLRYSVIHFSGVIYDSTHSDWSDPRSMLTTLKDEELRVGDDDHQAYMQAKGLEVLHANSNLEGLPKRTRKALLKNFTNSLPDNYTKRIKDEEERAVFAQILTAEDQNSMLYLELNQALGDDEASYNLMMAIEAQEAEIEALESKLSAKSLEHVKAARAKKAETLKKIYVENAKAKIRQLNDAQALKVLEDMYKQGDIPDPVWKEIQVFTQLRAGVEGVDWIEAKKNMYLKGVKGKTPEEEEKIQQWRAILKKKGFHSHFTSWRAHHADTLDPSIASEMKCDQLGSMVQHLRGHKRPGGLLKNMRYYREQSEGGNAQAYLKNPDSLEDLKRGASLYWIGWTKNTASKEGAAYVKKLSALKSKFTRKEKEVGREARKLEAKHKRGRRKGEYRLRGKSRTDQELKVKGLTEEMNRRKHEYEGKLQQEGNVPMFDPKEDKPPDISQLAVPTAHTGGTASVGNLQIKEGKHADGWTYKVIRDARYGGKAAILRVRPNKPLCTDDSCLEFSTERNPEVIKQYLRITHEATVYHADSTVTLTYDTRSKFDGEKVRGMGLQKRLTGDILGNPKVWVGYAPEQTDPSLISPYLLDSMVNDQSVVAP